VIHRTGRQAVLNFIARRVRRMATLGRRIHPRMRSIALGDGPVNGRQLSRVVRRCRQTRSCSGSLGWVDEACAP